MPLSIATYNVLDLFDPEPGDEAGKTLLDEKIAFLTRKLDDVDADVVGLQEIGSEDALERLASSLARGPYARVVGTPDARGIRCALLTRLPILAAEVLTTPALPFPVFVEGDPPPFGARLPLRRGVVQVELDAGGDRERLFVLVVHFKSGRPAPLKTAAGEVVEPQSSFAAMQGTVRSVVFRAAEALFVRQALDAIFARHPEARIAVVGDFNDVWSSIVFRAVRGLKDTELFDATRSIPYERRHTLMHFGSTRAIDHVLVSAPLLARVTSAHVFNEDLRDHDALRAAGETRFADSDHAPLVVRFD